MNTTDRITEALALAQPHELLSTFVVSFNDQCALLDEVTEQRDRLEQELTTAVQRHHHQASLLATLEDAWDDHG